MIGERLSFQLYSARKFPPLEAQLDELAGLGLVRVEPYGDLLDPAHRLAEALAERGMSAPSGHIGLADLDGAGRGGAAEIGIQAERPAPFAEDEAAGIVFAEPGGGA